MAVEKTTRLQVVTWSVDEDPISRAQFTESHENLESFAAKFTTGSSLPTATSQFARAFFYDTSTSTLYFSPSGTSWLVVGVGTDFVRTATTQTLTNKTLTSPVISTISNTGTVTLPTATDTLVGRATTDTLTNKTLTDPAINFAVMRSPEEIWSVNASAPSSTQNLFTQTAAAYLFTSNAANNVTLNITGATGGVTLNSLLATGASITCAMAMTNGATPYYVTAVQVDGSAQTVRWQGGNTPSSGNANSIDIYTFTIIKTASATFTAIGSLTRFA